MPQSPLTLLRAARLFESIKACGTSTSSRDYYRSTSRCGPSHGTIHGYVYCAASSRKILAYYAASKLRRHTVTDYRHCAEIQDCSLEGSKTASALPSYISYILLPISIACTSLCLFLRLPYIYIPLNFHRFTIRSFMQFSHTAKAYISLYLTRKSILYSSVVISRIFYFSFVLAIEAITSFSIYNLDINSWLTLFRIEKVFKGGSF